MPRMRQGYERDTLQTHFPVTATTVAATPAAPLPIPSELTDQSSLPSPSSTNILPTMSSTSTTAATPNVNFSFAFGALTPPSSSSSATETKREVPSNSFANLFTFAPPNPPSQKNEGFASGAPFRFVASDNVNEVSSSSSSAPVASLQPELSKENVGEYPPCVNLFFNQRLMAASPQTLRAVQIWPEDHVLQSLFTAIIDIAAEEKEKNQRQTILTPTATVALAGCALRMANYLIGSAAKLGVSIGSAMEPLRLNDVLGDKRESTLTSFQQQQQDDWFAGSAFPRPVVEQWWQLAETAGFIPMPEDRMREMVVCSAYVAKWIQLLLDSMDILARKNGSPLLTVGILNSEFEQLHTHVQLAHVFKHLGSTAVYIHELPSSFEMETSQFFQPMDRSSSRSQFGFTLKVEASLDREVRGNFIEGVERDSVLMVLEHDNWYHRPEQLQKVAQQFISGERQAHPSDTLLSEYNIRPLRVHVANQDLPSKLFHYGLAKKNSKFPDVRSERRSLYLLATDANNTDWQFVYHKSWSGGDVYLLESPDVEHKVAHIPLNGHGGDPMVSQELVFDQFAPHLLQAHLHTIEVMKQAEAMYNQCLEQTKILNRPLEGFNPPSNAAFDVPSSSIGSEDRRGRKLSYLRASERNFSVENFINTLRTHAYQQISALAVRLIEYERWGFSRYSGSYPETLRREFQSHLMDAAMQANGMQLLPTALLDIIADYHTVDALPYITPAEQQAMDDSTRSNF